MKETTPEAIAARKMRERLAFLALPPAEAQQSLSYGPPGSLVDVTPPDQDLSYGIEPTSEDDALLDE